MFILVTAILGRNLEGGLILKGKNAKPVHVFFFTVVG